MAGKRKNYNFEEIYIEARHLIEAIKQQTLDNDAFWNAILIKGLTGYLTDSEILGDY